MKIQSKPREKKIEQKISWVPWFLSEILRGQLLIDY